MSDISGHFEGKEHVFPVRVYYEDTDAAQIVYYGNYLRFAERGRTEFLRLVYLDHGEMKKKHGVDWAIRRCEIDYISPARLDEALEVRTIVSELKGASMSMRQGIYRDGELLVKVDVRCVVIKSDGRPARIPQNVRDTLKEYYLETES
ncbi:MAG: tol-pal system-associated acyl-CoA thioesterase [Rhodospirillales bacterium]|nr:tol-pal system-associated acyl-CoA thioesterase [Rhodospirillales bacterium]